MAPAGPASSSGGTGPAPAGRSASTTRKPRSTVSAYPASASTARSYSRMLAAESAFMVRTMVFSSPRLSSWSSSLSMVSMVSILPGQRCDGRPRGLRQLLPVLVGQFLAGLDAFADRRQLIGDPFTDGRLRIAHPLRRQLVEQAFVHRVEDGHLI